MANEWNTSYPLDHTKIGDVPGEIRKLKDSTKDQLSLEHEAPVDGDATGSEHSSGSAVAYAAATAPTTRPGGAALADNTIDKGRIWLDDAASPGSLKRWNGSAFTETVKALGGWTPAAYAGEGSITFPNGMIVKFGSQVLANGSYDDTTVTFPVAFPTDCSAVFLTSWDTNETSGDYEPSAHTFAAATFKIRCRIGTRLTPMGWLAIGY